MNQINVQDYKTKYGELLIGSFENKLCILDWKYRKNRNSIDNKIKKAFNAEFVKISSKIIEETKIQLEEYFNLKRENFNIPILTIGTKFQKKVWKALLDIPYGKTSSYLQLSKNIGNEKAVRAVANANGANVIGIIIPCHRIIGSDGTLTGYAGGLEAKKQLLNLEKCNLSSI